MQSLSQLCLNKILNTLDEYSLDLLRKALVKPRIYHLQTFVPIQAKPEKGYFLLFVDEDYIGLTDHPESICFDYASANGGNFTCDAFYLPDYGFNDIVKIVGTPKRDSTVEVSCYYSEEEHLTYHRTTKQIKSRYDLCYSLWLESGSPEMPINYWGSP